MHVSSLKWSGRAPYGTVLLRAFIGSKQEALLHRSDADVAAAARRDIEATTSVAGDPIMTHVVRWVDAMPQYTVGRLDRVTMVFEALRATSNLIVCGSAYRGVGLPDCIAQGHAAAGHAQELLSAGCHEGGKCREMKAGKSSDAPLARQVQSGAQHLPGLLVLVTGHRERGPTREARDVRVRRSDVRREQAQVGESVTSVTSAFARAASGAPLATGRGTTGGSYRTLATSASSSASIGPRSGPRMRAVRV